MEKLLRQRDGFEAYLLGACRRFPGRRPCEALLEHDELIMGRQRNRNHGWPLLGGPADFFMPNQNLNVSPIILTLNSFFDLRYIKY